VPNPHEFNEKLYNRAVRRLRGAIASRGMWRVALRNPLDCAAVFRWIDLSGS
jgi:hypothetical protein